jgi:GT2 family glycosyltransferase
MNICGVIVSYFGSEDTIRCVRSLMSQGITKVLVMDNSADRDETAILEEAFRELGSVEILTNGVNNGFAGGINYILDRDLGDKLDAYLLLNNDTIAPEGFVQALTAGMERSCLDIAAPLIYAFPEKHVLWSKGHCYSNLTGLITRKPLAPVFRTHPYLTGCCLLVRRAVFEKAGFFDDSFFLYGEDVEFCHRALTYGFSIGVIENAKLYHRISSSSKNNSLLYEYHINRGHLILTEKLSSSKLEYLISMQLKYLFLAVRALYRSIRYGNLNAIKGYAKAIHKKRAHPSLDMP